MVSSVKTPIGTYVGLSETTTFNRSIEYYTAFKGIAYAKSPVGLLRFRRPEPTEFKKDVVYNATYHRSHCTQTPVQPFKYTAEFDQSEDCLYLNIYCPGRGVTAGGKYPVMIYIHGGSFGVGGADVYAGDVLSAFNDVIVVTINYRLGVLGFLSSGQKHDGNYGLWDMHFAIKWVNSYIEYFGGDNTRVTLFGNSAGGAAVTYQAMFPGNRGLVHRVIAQSGTCFATWALTKSPARYFEKFSIISGCLDGGYKDVMDCLRQRTTSELEKAYEAIILEEKDYLFFPTIDGDFIFDYPLLLDYESNNATNEGLSLFSELDFMNGMTSKDGANFVLSFNNMSTWTLEEFKEYVSKELLYVYKRKSPEHIMNTVVQQYWKNSSADLIPIATVTEFPTDLFFAYPAVLASVIHNSLNTRNRSGNNYLYVFDQVPSFTSQLSMLEGVTHAYELPFVFGFTEHIKTKYTADYSADNPLIPSHEDIEMSSIVMQLWTNFAKYGNPNKMKISNHHTLPVWRQYDTISGDYLILKLPFEDKIIRKHYAAQQMSFIEDLHKDMMHNGLCAMTSVFVYVVMFQSLLFI
ncbi:acetylcholinesterase-like [Dreissena polymorpha]|nr:acetylcholinesterase-like [Dreissena polymorpha]